MRHVCEKKQRWADKDKPANRIAYEAWYTFLSYLQPSAKTNRDYRGFISSQYYSAFLKFGLYCVEVRVVNTQAYIRYVIKNNITIDNWTSDKVYTTYLVEYLLCEDANDAIKRSIDHMLTIANAENIKLNDVLRYSNKNMICHKIVSGHISPWILYLSECGNDFLSSLNTDQRNVVWDYINIDKWQSKFQRDQQLFNDIKQFLDRALS